MKKIISRKPLTHFLGTALMIIAVGVFIYIYLPIIQLYINPVLAVSQPISQEFSIRIPSIQAYAPVIKNVDPSNEKEYTAQLRKGVAHAKGFALPDQQGSMFLFAHSSDYPWNITRVNTAFFRLHELKIGQSVEIRYNGKIYRYTVREIKNVWPHEIDAVNKSNHRLILQTCTPVGTSLKRLLVFAD